MRESEDGGKTTIERDIKHSNFRDRFIRCRAAEAIGKDDGVMVDKETLTVRRDHTTFKTIADMPPKPPSPLSPEVAKEIHNKVVNEVHNTLLPGKEIIEAKNFDREMLFMCYGALRSVSDIKPGLKSIVADLETYLDPKPIIVHKRRNIDACDEDL